MAKKKDTDDDASQDVSLSSSPYHKKHKHKKHKKHKKKRSHSSESPDYGITTSFSSETVSSDSTGKPALKLKIKFGGHTFGTKNVDRLTIPESTSEEEEEEEEEEEVAEEVESEGDTFTWQDETPPASLNQSVASSDKDEEEAWLDALEAGELNDYGEIKSKQKDPSTLTARQRALLHGTTEEERHLTQLPNLTSRPATEITSEMLEKKAQRAQKRRVQAKQKVEENKKQTIERLLKKQDFKNKGQKGRSKKLLNLPCVSYINSIYGMSLSYPAGRPFPMTKAVAQPPKPRPTCGVTGCRNTKRYSCSKTGLALCSLACYKKNLSNATVQCMT